MKLHIHTRPEAEQDIAAARDWYDKVQIGLGDAFLDEISAAIHQLAAHPETPRLYYRNFRRILLRRFPYKVFYQVIGLTNRHLPRAPRAPVPRTRPARIIRHQ